MKNLPYSIAQPPGLLRKAVALVATVTVFGLALMFSVMLFAVVLSAGAVAFAYLWWKTRDLRKQMRMHPPGGAAMEEETIEGEVIEGEVIERTVVRDDGGDRA